MGGTWSSMGHTPIVERYDVVDFRSTRDCMKYKYRTMGEYIEIEPCTDEDLHNMILLSCQKSPCFVIDETKKGIKGGLPVVIDRKLIQADGILDISLHNCKNVKDISIEIDGVGSIYTKQFEEPLSGKFQIPVSSDASTVEITRKKNDRHIEISFIPFLVFIHNKVTITLNKDAEALLSLSNVYFSIEKRRELCRNVVHFQFNGNLLCYNPLSHKEMFKVKKNVPFLSAS